MLEEAAREPLPLPPPRTHTYFLLDLKMASVVTAVATFIKVPHIPSGFYQVGIIVFGGGALPLKSG